MNNLFNNSVALTLSPCVSVSLIPFDLGTELTEYNCRSVISVCVVSVCVVSVCVVSVCVISVCVVSLCVVSVCVISACVISV